MSSFLFFLWNIISKQSAIGLKISGSLSLKDEWKAQTFGPEEKKSVTSFKKFFSNKLMQWQHLAACVSKLKNTEDIFNKKTFFSGKNYTILRSGWFFRCVQDMSGSSQCSICKMSLKIHKNIWKTQKQTQNDQQETPEEHKATQTTKEQLHSDIKQPLSDTKWPWRNTKLPQGNRIISEWCKRRQISVSCSCLDRHLWLCVFVFDTHDVLKLFPRCDSSCMCEEAAELGFSSLLNPTH